ncbi:hypothetical protein BH24ACT26_BH24ACT26_13260 [soil metagenome]
MATAKTRARAARRSRDAGRAFAGAIVAGVVYDLSKAAFTRLWNKSKQRRAGRQGL